MSLSSLLVFSSSSGPSTGTCWSLTCLNQISRLLSKSSCSVDRACLLLVLVSAKVLVLSLCFNHVTTVLLGRSSLLHMIDGLTPPSISSIISSIWKAVQAFLCFLGTMIAQDWPGPQCIMGNSESIYYSVSYFLAKLSKSCETLFSCDKERLELSFLHKNVNTSSHRKGNLMALTTVYQYELWQKVRYIPSQLSLPRQGPWNLVWVNRVFELSEFHCTWLLSIFGLSCPGLLVFDK